MGISVRDRKFLWGWAGNRCAFPSCDRKLVMTVAQSTSTSVVGEEAHIISGRLAGPRGDQPIDDVDRESYDNIILLCGEHHKIIDDDPIFWTVDLVKQMKKDHEAAIEARLASTTEVVDVQYAEFVDRWVELCNLDLWSAWTSHLLAPRPTVYTDDLEHLRALAEWLFTRSWPKVYVELENALKNFRVVANQMVAVIDRTFEPWGDDQRMIVTFYKAEYFAPDVYDRLADEFDWIVSFIHDMTAELTRAANWVLDAVRRDIDPLFRLDEGNVFFERDEGVFNFVKFRAEYEPTDVVGGAPFGGIEAFATTRSTRNYYVDSGVNPGALARVLPMRIGD